MMYLNIDNVEEWATKNNLEIITYMCPMCNKQYKSDVPFRMKGYLGLETKVHECGWNYKKTIVVPNTNEEIDFWKTIV